MGDPRLGQSEVAGVGEPSGSPQLHPGSLTLFKVRAYPGRDGEGREVWATEAQRRAHSWPGPQGPALGAEPPAGPEGAPVGVSRGTFLEYQTPGLILSDREETEVPLRDELAQDHMWWGG